MVKGIWDKVKGKGSSIPLLLVLFAVVLRIIDLTGEGFWFDEALTALSMKMPFFEMVSDRLAGGHSPFYFIVIYPFVKIFGNNELVLRSPSVIASIASVYIFYLLAKKLFSDEKISIFTTVIFSMSALNVYFAQEARMYAMIILAAVCSFYFLLRALDEDSWKLWAGYIVSTALMFNLSASTLPVIFAQIAYVLIAGRRKIPGFLLSFSIIGLFYVPMAYFYMSMGKLTFIEWVAPPTLRTLKEIFYGFAFSPVPIRGPSEFYKIYISIVRSLSIYFMGGLFLYGAISSFIRSYKAGKLDKNGKAALFLILWFVLPLIIILFYSLFRQPIFGPKRYVIVFAPAYYLLLGVSLKEITLERLKNALMAILIIMFSVTLIIFYNTPTRENWKGAIAYIDKNYKQGEVVFGNLSTQTMYKYYGKKSDLEVTHVKYLFIRRGVGRGWFLIKERDYKKAFGNSDLIKKTFNAKNIEGFWGLKLYRLGI